MNAEQLENTPSHSTDSKAPNNKKSKRLGRVLESLLKTHQKYVNFWIVEGN